MNRLELLITLLRVTEDAATVLYNKHGFTDADGLGPIPVEMWGDADHSVVPMLLIDDRQDHEDVSVGNTSRDGPAVDANTGEVLGQRHRYETVANPRILLRWNGAQSDAVRIIGALRDRFRRFNDKPDAFAAKAPTGMLELDEQHVVSFNTEGISPVEVDHRSADNVYQEALDLSVRYADIIVDEDPEPIKGIHTNVDGTGDGEIDQSFGLGTITVAEGGEYVVTAPYTAPDTLIVNGDVFVE